MCVFLIHGGQRQLVDLTGDCRLPYREADYSLRIVPQQPPFILVSSGIGIVAAYLAHACVVFSNGRAAILNSMVFFCSTVVWDHKPHCRLPNTTRKAGGENWVARLRRTRDACFALLASSSETQKAAAFFWFFCRGVFIRVFFPRRLLRTIFWRQGTVFALFSSLCVSLSWNIVIWEESSRQPLLEPSWRQTAGLALTFLKSRFLIEYPEVYNQPRKRNRQ